jgi:hypothetical protein
VEGMILKLVMPPDSTFLSQAIYEGVLYILNFVPDPSFKFGEAILPSDSLCRAYGSMDEGRIDGISVALNPNDNKGVGELLGRLGIGEELPKKTYRELLRLLKERNMGMRMAKDVLTIKMEMKRDKVFLGSPDRGEDLSAPQLFKIDRYTGISALEMETTSKQIGLRASPEVILIGLLGIYSSHVTTIRQRDNAYHYFLFLSHDEIAKLLNSGDPLKLRVIYSIKEELRDLLSRTLRSSVVNEVMILEVMLSTGMRAELESKNLDKVDFNVFKISPEGRTYKIYETIPMSLYREPMFYEALSGRRGIRADRVCEALYEALSPNGLIMDALSSFNSRDKFREADSILKGVLGLYKFVSLADAQGLLQFVRSLEEARAILRDDERARFRAEGYARIQKALSYAL